MKVFLASDMDGKGLKDALVEEVKRLGYDYEDLTEEGFDLVDSSKAVCQKLLEVDGMLTSGSDDQSVGVVIDKYGAGSYMGSSIVGEELAKSCLRSFLSHGYDGGRHQIRIDMLNKML